MGFCRAELSINGKERSFFLPDTPHAELPRLWQGTHRIADQVVLHVYADKDYFSERQFALISDIAAEAWSKAAVRWKVVKGSPFVFDAEAGEPSDEREQKARSLYRPRY